MADKPTGHGTQIALGILAAVATIAAAIISNWPIFPPDPPPTTSLTTPSEEVDTTVRDKSGTGRTDAGAADSSGTTSAPPASEGDCRITIANPLAVILEDPDVFGQQVAPVPAGVYKVEEVANVTFGPQSQRWFRITVDGRTGWIRDSSFDVESKTATCP